MKHWGNIDFKLGGGTLANAYKKQQLENKQAHLESIQLLKQRPKEKKHNKKQNVPVIWIF